MAFRFRKSIKVFPGFTINVGKTGVSASVGVPGAKVTLGKKGVRKTVGIPGTGASYTDYRRYGADEADGTPGGTPGTGSPSRPLSMGGILLVVAVIILLYKVFVR